MSEYPVALFLCYRLIDRIRAVLAVMMCASLSTICIVGIFLTGCASSERVVNVAKITPAQRSAAINASRESAWDKAAMLWTDIVRAEPESAEAHSELAYALVELDRIDEAIQHSQRATVLEPDNSYYFNDLCWRRILAGQYTTARPDCEQALALEPMNWGAALNLGHTWLLTGQTERARPYYLQALGYLPDQQRLDDGPQADFDLFIARGWQVAAARGAAQWFAQQVPTLWQANAIDAEVLSLYREGRYPAAISKARTSLALREKILGPAHPTIADSINSLAVLASSNNNYVEAEQLYRRALTIRENALGPTHAVVATSVNNLASFLVATGHYAQAEPLLQRALAIDENALGSDHPFFATDLNNRAELLRMLGRYAEAEPLYRRALAIEEKALPPDHPAIASSLVNLALLLENTGHYDEAESLLRRALAIREKTAASDRLAIANTLNNLAELLQTKGRYAEAETLYRDALTTRETTLGSMHTDVAVSLNNLAQLLQTTGRYTQAEPLMWRALKIDEAVLPVNRLTVATDFNNLATLLKISGQVERAELLYRRALVMREISLGANHPLVAQSLNNLAALLHMTGRPAEAESLYRRALAIDEHASGAHHPDVAIELNNLAALLEDSGRSAEAETLYQRALQIGSVAGDPELLHSVEGNLMHIYQQEYPALAIFYGKQAVNTLQSLRAGLLNTTRETQQAFIEKISATYQTLADILIEQGRLPEAEQVLAMLKEQEYFDFVRRDAAANATATQASYTQVEAPWSKRYGEISSHLVALGREHADLSQIQQALRTPEQQARLAQLDGDLDAGRAEVSAFLETLQADFAKRGGTQAVAFGARELDTLESLQSELAQLGQGVVVVHYLVTPERLRILVTTPEVQLHRDSAVSEKELNRLVTAYREVLQDPRRDPLPLAQKLYDMLLKPIQPDLQQAGAKTLVVSLDGSLRYLPIAALHDGTQWVAQRYGIAMYTAAARNNLVAAPHADWTVAGLGVSRGVTIDGRQFSSLPSVPLELASIVRSASDQSGVLPGSRYLDEQFTSEALVEAIRKRFPVLHLATHFHFAAGGTEADSFLLLGDGHKLTLADLRIGVNYRLSQVELLTLSACETALGEANADGSEVEGLGALAQKRGAKAVLATLWSVADTSTGIFMRTLYESRQQHQLTKAAALREAQLAFIDGRANTSGIPKELRGAHRKQAEKRTADYHTDPGKPFAHPYYWAPFVLMGNWL